ncbi:MAG TPA: DUF1877 family protein [Blastocatellia bacterium]|nr:DUF1877 family protein [Blastocatellia bacterium]
MGISITAYIVAENELESLRTDPKVLKKIEASQTGSGQGYLSSYWRMLNAIITEKTGSSDLPAAALIIGNFNLPKLEDGAHWISPGTNKQFAAILSNISEEDVRQYVKRHESNLLGPAAAKEGKSMTEIQLRSATAEYWIYVSKLRQVSNLALESNAGLLFVKWEDW